MDLKVEDEINRLRGLALIFAIPFQFIFFRPHVNFLILLPPAAFFVFFLFAGYQMTERICLDPSKSHSEKFKSIFSYRIRRLVPILLIWLLIANICSYFYNSSGAFGPMHVVAKDSATVLTLCMNFLKSFAYNQEPSPYFNVLGTYWHLDFEEQYCLGILLLLFLVQDKHRVFVLTAITFLSAYALREIPYKVPHEIEGYFNAFSFHKNVTHFCIGSLVYVMKEKGHLNFLKRCPLTLLQWGGRFLMGVCLFYFLIFTKDITWKGMTPYWLSELTLMSIIASGLVTLTFSGLTSQILDYIGSRFYALYLGHAIVLRFVEESYFRLTENQTGWTGLPFQSALINSILTIVLLILVSEFIHRWTQPLR